MTPRDRWLAATWPFVAGHLPRPPGRVLEIGCGPAGGFVPALHAAGYRAVGVDPQAPAAPGYHRVGFEDHTLTHPAEVIVACTSLHHVADLDSVLDKVVRALVPDGTFVVVEWAWEHFDERTARWCFARLPPPDPAAEAGWLPEQQRRWAASGRPWTDYRSAWAAEEGLHPGHAITAALRERFETRLCVDGPYFFPDLDAVTEASERAAIEAGQIRATGIQYVGTPRQGKRNTPAG